MRSNTGSVAIPSFRHIKRVGIIGGGPAGYVAAIRFAQRGFATTLIEQQFLGGTCLNWGCIPSKALIHLASEWSRAASATQRGLHLSPSHVEWPVLQQHIQHHVATLREGVAQRMKRLKVNVIQGAAEFVSPSHVQVEQELHTFDAVVIATGAETFIPAPFDVVQSPRVLTVQGFFALTHMPQQLAIVGAGVIGLELAQAMQRLGCKVTVYERAEALTLPAYEPKFLNALQERLKEEGVVLKFGHAIEACLMPETDQTVCLKGHSTGGEAFTHEHDYVLLAPGRKPNTASLNLALAGVEVHEASGGCVINEYYQTSQPHIFAIGDVVHANPQLAHVASHQGIALAETLSGNAGGCDDAMLIPKVMYTQPELACVGLTLQEAEAKGLKARQTFLPLATLGRAHVEESTDGQVALVVDEATGVILGAQAMAPHADMLISHMTQAMELGVTVQDMALTVHPHPSLSEAWLEVAERHLGHGIHI
jgi:dihydrolipoamide dehydrogenase